MTFDTAFQHKSVFRVALDGESDGRKNIVWKTAIILKGEKQSILSQAARCVVTGNRGLREVLTYS